MHFLGPRHECLGATGFFTPCPCRSLLVCLQPMCSVVASSLVRPMGLSGLRGSPLWEFLPRCSPSTNVDRSPSNSWNVAMPNRVLFLVPWPAGPVVSGSSRHLSCASHPRRGKEAEAVWQEVDAVHLRRGGFRSRQWRRKAMGIPVMRSRSSDLV